MPLPPPILGPQPPLPRITPMNQVMVEEMAQGWMELDPRITETHAKQLLSKRSFILEYSPKGPNWGPINQLN